MRSVPPHRVISPIKRHTVFTITMPGKSEWKELFLCAEEVKQHHTPMIFQPFDAKETSMENPSLPKPNTDNFCCIMPAPSFFRPLS